MFDLRYACDRDRNGRMTPNKIPTTRQIEALTDLLKYPGHTLKQRGSRLGCTRVAVGALFAQLERRGLAERRFAGWWVTPAARQWVTR